MAFFKPLLKINKNSVVYRSSNVVEYSPKNVFEYLKTHYRQEVKYCGGRIIKDCAELSSDPDSHTIEYAFKFEPAYDDVTKLFKKSSEAVAQQYW